MRRWIFAGLLATVVLGLSACSNFSYQHPIGVPTVVMERPQVSPDVANNTLTVVFKFHTIPGSPGGLVAKLDVDPPFPDYAPLIDVPACPASATADQCARSEWNLTIQPIPSIGSFVVRALTVQGYNGAVMRVALPTPAVIY